MRILGQKQLKPRPTGERAATVEKMELIKSSRKRRQSLRISFQRKLLFIFSRDNNRRVRLQEMFLLNGSKARLIWEHVRFAFFDDWRTPTLLHLLEQTKHKPEELPERQILIDGRPECKSVKLRKT